MVQLSTPWGDPNWGMRHFLSNYFDLLFMFPSAVYPVFCVEVDWEAWEGRLGGIRGQWADCAVPYQVRGVRGSITKNRP